MRRQGQATKQSHDAPGATPFVATSAIAALRAATWSSHQRLERRLDVKARFSSLEAYRAHLERMWGFCAALEEQLGAEPFGAALPDFEARRKLPLLRRDLRFLGADQKATNLLARCPSLPKCPDRAAAFGSFYVIEGATLGGRSLLPLVARGLGLAPRRGAAFLASYGEEVLTMWRSFGAALDRWCSSADRQARASAAAVATFDALDEWLCGRPA